MTDFMKSLFKIAVPVTIQCMLQSSFSIIDQLMIGQLGKESIAAVGICGNYSLVFSVLTGAVCTVAGILISQFLGAEDREEAWGSFNLSMLVCIAVSALFTSGLLFTTRSILGLYSSDEGILVEGVKYCRLVSITFIPMGISSIASTWLRCREHAVFPLLASFCAVLVNTGLNYGLIFGRLGLPAMQIKGAALATLISQLLNLLLISCGFFVSNKIDQEKILLRFRLMKVSLREYLHMIVPILVGEFLWSLGQNVESAIYGHISTESLAAYTLTCPIQGLLIGALSGLSASAGVLVGKQLGKKDYEGAYKDAKKLLVFGIIGAGLMATVLILTSNFYVSLYNVERNVRSLGRAVLIVFALYSPFKVSNMILGGGVLKSGGDTKTVMIIDTVGTWAVGIPLCLMTAHVLKLNIVWVYTILTSEEIFRFLITFMVFRRKKWMKTIGTGFVVHN